MLLGVDKRRKGQDGAAEEDEDGGGGGDYGALPKAHARSGAGDGGCFCFIPSAPVSILPLLAMLPILSRPSPPFELLGWGFAG